MTLLYVMYYTFLRSIRDIKGLIEMLLMPVLLILILGNALSGQFQVSSIGRTPVGYVNLDQGELSSHFDRFLRLEPIQELLEIKEIDTVEAGITLLTEGEIRAVLHISPSYSEQFLEHGRAMIEVIGDGNNPFRTSIVRSIVDNYTSCANTIHARTALGGTPEYTRRQMLETVSLSARGNIPRAIDYYAVTMLVLFVLFGAGYSLYGAAEDYLEGMRARLLSTPTALYQHFAGKVLGTVLVIFTQALIIGAFTRIAYGVNWGERPLEVAFIFFTLSVFSTTMGLAAVMVAKDKKIANNVLMTIIPVMTFISGGYARIVSDSPVYNGIRLLLPSNLGHTALFNSIYGDFAGQTVSSTGILWAMTLVLGMVALAAGRRKFQ